MTMETPMPDLHDNVTLFKSFYSCVLLVFSIVLIMGLIFTGQTKIAADVSPVLAFILVWFAVIWLTMVEGGQASLVGLAPVQLDLYKDSHSKAHAITKICFTGDNLDRYLLGRQFLVVLTVFTINSAGAPSEGADLWGLPEWITNLFLGSGLAMILFTVMVGQLSAEVNASLCMLDFINNYFAIVVFWASMALEFSGVIHASYLIQYIVCWLAGKPVESREPPKTGMTWFFFWGRVIMSVGLLCFSFAVTLSALFQGKTTIWDFFPPVPAVILFFILMCFVGMLEAIQIAYFAVAKLCVKDRGTNIYAKNTNHILFSGDCRNLPAFMVGRQLCVVANMFFIARVTSVQIQPGEENIFGVSDGVQRLFDTGLLGALVTTIVGSISWRLVASVFPVAFFSSPISYFFLRLCLLLEATGLCQGAWVIGDIQKGIVGFQRDEVYIGTAEERAARNMADDGEVLTLGPGHMVMLPHLIEAAPESLKKLMEKDMAVAEFVRSISKLDLDGGANDDTDSAASEQEIKL